jgi:hypothetical protein
MRRGSRNGAPRRCKVLSADLPRNRAEFECPDGHRFKATLFRKDPLGQLPGETIRAKLLLIWRNNGVTLPCPKCRRG